MSIKPWWRVLHEIGEAIFNRGCIGNPERDPWEVVIEECKKAGLDIDPQACARIIPLGED